MSNLEYMRKFYLMYSTLEIPQTPFGESAMPISQTRFGDSVNTVCEIDAAEDSVNSVYQIPEFTLGWAHYLLLMRIADPVERALYEREATEQCTSVMPSKLALKRIVIEEKSKFEKEKLLALAAAKQMPVSGRKGSLP